MPEHDGDEMNNPALRWYGWGSPVGLGLLVLLLSASAAIIRLAFFH
jgi:hypothetical protein